MAIVTGDQINASDFSGMIVLWHGALTSIPTGWVLCDGNNGTPNLLDKFVKSVPDAGTDPGATGGSSTHTLTTSEMPAHTHTTPTGVISGSISVSWNTGTPGSSGLGSGSGSTGGGSAHENEPQHYEVAFIMKT